MIDQQSGLCAYCEISLRMGNQTEADDFRVEHFHPKSDNSTSHNWNLDWHNLLGCCHGGARSDVVDSVNRFTSPDHSCDIPKRDKNLDTVILNPLHIPPFPVLFSVQRSSGQIKVHVANCQIAGISSIVAQGTLDELCLDSNRLRRFRCETLNNLNQQMQILTKQGLSILEAKQRLAQVYLKKNNDQHWPAFFTSIRSYLGEEAEDYLRQIGYQG